MKLVLPTQFNFVNASTSYMYTIFILRYQKLLVLFYLSNFKKTWFISLLNKLTPFIN